MIPSTANGSPSTNNIHPNHCLHHLWVLTGILNIGRRWDALLGHSWVMDAKTSNQKSEKKEHHDESYEETEKRVRNSRRRNGGKYAQERMTTCTTATRTATMISLPTSVNSISTIETPTTYVILAKNRFCSRREFSEELKKTERSY